MRIEFVKAWGVYAIGAVTTAVPPGVADTLVRRGIAKPAKGKGNQKPKG